MDLDETGLSALATLADAVVASPREFEVLAAAAIDDARRFDSHRNASALAAAADAVESALSQLEPDAESRTVGTVLLAARSLRDRNDRLSREAGRALAWALENQHLLAARRDCSPSPSGSLKTVDRETSRPMPIEKLVFQLA